MTILCLHGAYSSAANFEVQLRPFIDAIEQCDGVDFKCIDGGHSTEAPKGTEDFFGTPPLYRFLDLDSHMAKAPSRIRDLPKGPTAEDSMRILMGHQEVDAYVVQQALGRVIRVLDDDPEIDGILGYSEGAAAAASLIVEEGRLSREEGRPRRIKYAVFFGGWPPVRGVSNSVLFMLADECDDMIDIPTCHIIGCNDPYIDGAMALFNVCDEDTATLFDHGEGHNVPRNATTLSELVTVFEKTRSLKV